MSGEPLKLVTSRIPTNTKALIAQQSQAIRRVDDIVMGLPDTLHTNNLSIAIDRLTETTGGVVSTLLAFAEKNDKQKAYIASTNSILLDNVTIMQKLHNLNKGLWSNKIDTILNAILYIEETMSEQFPGISTRILLTPCQDEGGRLIENPIAQMLADTIEINSERFSDANFSMTSEEKGEKEKLSHLISLLPILEGAIKKESVPDELHIVGIKNIFTRKNKPSHVLTPKEILELDPAIFGTPGSVLMHPIPNVGEIIFSSQNPDHYSPEQDTLILTNAIENLGIFLAYIGKDEKNKKDLLTSLPLRRGFEEKASALLRLAQQKGEQFSFVLIDADHFKQVNDNYGHAAGDLVLKTLAKILMQKLKTEDIPVRWGGEEFGVFMQTDPEGATRAIQRVMDTLAKITFQIDSNGTPSIAPDGDISPGNTGFSVTISAGIAGNRNSPIISDKIEPIKSVTLEGIIMEADKRLYIAKKTGRNRIIAE